tara:strand:- start:35 stop:277 length:243 start_codon:yes stop_codon:yes gene_type:complete
MLTFESTHEYYLGGDPCLFYCEDHESLIVTPDHENRVVLTGIKKQTMLDFATKLYKKDLEQTLESIKAENLTKEETVNVE